MLSNITHKRKNLIQVPFQSLSYYLQDCLGECYWGEYKINPVLFETWLIFFLFGTNTLSKRYEKKY